MPTIALVDDDRNILTSLRMVLEAEGYKTQTYNDGASALDGFAESPPDLGVVDDQPAPLLRVAGRRGLHGEAQALEHEVAGDGPIEIEAPPHGTCGGQQAVGLDEVEAGC